jgi:HD-GYP domain-containing protein (c-di-GMP phosphodiesterase class II)
VGVILLGSIIAHQTLLPDDLGYLGAAVWVWAGDLLTSPLVLAPITGEKPLPLLYQVFRATALSEATQYFIGLLGVLAAQRNPWALVLLALPTASVYLVSRRASEVEEETHHMLTSLADTVDLRDPLTGGHSRRVAALVQDTLVELAVPASEAQVIVSAARIHDIGKIGIPDDILLKPGRLTLEERDIMNMHPERGAELLERYPDFREGARIIRHHHEAWDGTGYPHRLAGDQIPFGSRVIAVADSFDAMTSDRPYRPALGVDQAVATLRRGRGEQWDPVVVDAFLRSISHQLGTTRARLTVVPGHAGGPAASA